MAQHSSPFSALLAILCIWNSVPNKFHSWPHQVVKSIGSQSNFNCTSFINNQKETKLVVSTLNYTTNNNCHNYLIGPTNFPVAIRYLFLKSVGSVIFKNLEHVLNIDSESNLSPKCNKKKPKSRKCCGASALLAGYKYWITIKEIQIYLLSTT